MADTLNKKGLLAVSFDSAEDTRAYLVEQGLSEQHLEQGTTWLSLETSPAESLAYEHEGVWQLTVIGVDRILEADKKLQKINEEPVLYEGRDNTYRTANKALREAAAVDGVTISNAEILYQCLIHGEGTTWEGEQTRPYSTALDSTLDAASITKRQLDESKLEVIATGPHNGEQQKEESVAKEEQPAQETPAEPAPQPRPRLRPRPRPSGAAPSETTLTLTNDF